MKRYCHISVAIPLLAELENLPALLDRFRCQSWQHYTLYLCVNNEEGGFGYDQNQASLQLLRAVDDLPLVVIDRSSKGLGWSGKNRGVGWARKVLFAKILDEHDANEVIVSLDADTDFDNNYLESVIRTFNSHPQASAVSVPYYHPLSGQESLDRPMLRYECYMRHYLINLLRIHSPYAFTALGSAMAFPLWAYKAVGGITPLQAGEDFYLMQKFAKTGHIISLLDTSLSHQPIIVRPQGRVSSRVPFGTGPAIAKGVASMDDSYPFYAQEGFDTIKATYELFPALYQCDVDTPMTAFLQQQIGSTDLWGPLRKNFKTQERFIHACAERVDGLRILQFLKRNPAYRLSTNQLPVNFLSDSIEDLNAFRDQLFDQEMSLRRLQ